MANPIIKPRNTVKIIKRKVLDAYFAEIKTEEVAGADSKEDYTVKSGDTLNKIAKKKGTTVKAIIALNNKITDANKHLIKVGQKIKLTKKSTKKKISFIKIASANLGQEVYVIVKTDRLQGKVVQFNVLQGKTKGLNKKEESIWLQQDGNDVEAAAGCVGEFTKDKDIVNKDDFDDWAIIKIKIGPKDKAELKKYTDTLEELTDKKTSLFLLIDAHTQSGVKVIYNGENPATDGEPDPRKTPNYWLDMDDKWFEIKFFEKKVCPIDPKHRSHFVIHCTAGSMTEVAIKKKVEYYTKKKVKKKKRSAAHIYVMKDGSKVEVWPLTEKNVWATKIEKKKNLKGQMFHIELNYGSPSVPSEAQYKTLADLYIEASNIENCWPIIVPHIEVDRGLADGHKDPTDFKYDYFYSILKNKGVPIDLIKKFDHDRYWGHKSYKMPWSDDSTNWPPKLKGNPHK